MKEEWRDIRGYEGRYLISSFGRVKSLNYHRENKEKILKLSVDKHNYLHIMLCKNGRKKRFQIHRLVAEAFIPNPNNYPIINHKDENPSNNCVTNLEWCTHKYNINYGTRNKKSSEIQIINGKKKYSKNYNSRKVQCVTTGRKFNTIKEAGEYYLLSNSTISSITQCCRGKIKSAGKHPVTGEKLKWKYLDE